MTIKNHGLMSVVFMLLFCAGLERPYNLDAEAVLFASSAYKGTPEAKNAAKKHT